jgi:hypothetical protein
MRTELAKTLKRIALGATLATVATSGFAATQGSTGFTSVGDLDISLTVANEVKISNLSDIVLPGFTGTDVSGTSAACVYRNAGTTYNITATGSGAANAFTLTDGTNTVAYGVTYDDGSGATALATGVALAADGAEGVDDDCSTAGANNGSIEVTVTAAAAAGLPAATYSGTLTLLVAPF